MRYALLALACGLLGGCGESKPPPPDAATVKQWEEQDKAVGAAENAAAKGQKP